MDEHHEVSALRNQEVLAARARVLARPLEVTACMDSIDAVVFTLQGEQYGVDVRLVREVYPMRRVTPVPCTPPFVLGLLNVRGSLFPVLDLRRFFGLASIPPDERAQALLVSGSGLDLCLRADAVSEVTTVSLANLGAPLETNTAVSRDFIRGIGGSMLVFLDLEALLADPRLRVQEEVI